MSRVDIWVKGDSLTRIVLIVRLSSGHADLDLNSFISIDWCKVIAAHNSSAPKFALSVILFICIHRSLEKWNVRTKNRAIRQI